MIGVAVTVIDDELAHERFCLFPALGFVRRLRELAAQLQRGSFAGGSLSEPCDRPIQKGGGGRRMSVCPELLGNLEHHRARRVATVAWKGEHRVRQRFDRDDVT